jgi:hypothetical protein
MYVTIIVYKNSFNRQTLFVDQLNITYILYAIFVEWRKENHVCIKYIFLIIVDNQEISSL